MERWQFSPRRVVYGGIRIPVSLQEVPSRAPDSLLEAGTFLIVLRFTVPVRGSDIKIRETGIWR